MIDPNITRIAADIARVDDASTLDELADLYVGIVGYDPREDDPACTADYVREMLTGYLGEMLANYRGA
jgi:hypothetical protein